MIECATAWLISLAAVSSLASSTRSQGRTPRTSRGQGDSEPIPTPPRRGALSDPLLGAVGVGRFMGQR